MFTDDWTRLVEPDKQESYSSYIPMTQSAQTPKQQYTLFKEEQMRHSQSSTSPYLRAVHKHIPISETGRRHTTDLEVEATLGPLGLCRLQIPADGACMVCVIFHIRGN